MAPRTTYANLADGLQPFGLWDASLADMGKLGAIPCTAAGTNAITLTQAAANFSPTITAYQNYQLFSFVPASNSTGTVAVRLGALPSLNLYKADGATQATAGDLVSTAVVVAAYNSALNSGNGGLQIIGASSSVGTRERLTTARTYFVRTDGNNSNNGLTNSPSGAFLTLQKAVSVVLSLDFNGNTVTVQLGNGTYSGQTVIDAPCVGVTGSQQFIIMGDTTTPSNVVLSHTDIAFQVLDGADVYLQGVKVTTSGGIASIWVTRAARLWYASIDFGTAAGFHVWTTDTGLSVANGNYKISGGAQVHQDSDTYGIAFPGFSNTVTITGTPAFSTAFIQATIGGIVETSGVTYSGSCTGSRYFVSQGGIVSTSAGGPNYFPGNSAGTLSSGGIYDTTVAGREVLTGSRTYFVRTDGNDSNTGLINNAGGAFLTIQAGVNAVAALDISTNSVFIQVGDGTYIGAVNLLPVVGSGSVTLQGNTTTPANVVISTTSTTAIAAFSAGKWALTGLTVQTTTSGDGISAIGGSTTLTLSKVFFGAVAAGWRQLIVQSNATAVIIANYTISGGGGYHMLAQNGGQITAFTGLTITVSGTPAFGVAFAQATTTGVVDFGGQTFSGSATGVRFIASNNGMINSGGGGANYFPGNSAGSGTNAGTTPFGLYA